MIDIGATIMRFGWSSSEFSPPFAIISTPDTSEELVEVICTHVQRVDGQSGERVTGLAIGCPGLVDHAGRIHAALYVALSGVDLQEVLQQKLQLPIVVVNDAKAQALGCARQGESLFYIGIGTAIGGAHIDNGQLVQGQNGFAGEIGHIAVGNSVIRCACGQYGCLDTTASGWHLEQILGAEWWELPRTTEIENALENAGEDVGAAAVLLAVLLDSTRIIIAGHISGHQEFQQGVLKRWNQRAWASTLLEFYTDTWSFSWAGLSRIAEMEIRERGKTDE